ncbi:MULTISPECIES: hypothetical protein [unclassified Microbacterium]|uniref:hypothetical protein n=1 Tax=unclassified Microbacterium TaxID=2609290 RepID=UPI001604AA96|nr:MULTISPECIES: hypothetical protein [unclassified Microbacterium]QNA93807.1 hypothetical protein G4G29_18700 [Microbacterium sp. Se63.02b]QYM64102.1 hypothetical protein K1X59_18775 [Microbacterium sp. Se5.02b]
MTPAQEWPGDAATVTRWVRASLRPEEAELEVRGLADVRVSCEVAGDDLEHLTLDASDVELRVRAPKNGTASSAAATTPSETPAVVHRRRGTARTLRVTARPVRIEGVPLTIDAQVHDTPVEWLVYAEPAVAGRPESRFGIEVVEEGAGMRGSLLASLGAADLTPLLTRVLRPAVQAGGMRLRRVRAHVAQDGADGIRVDVAAGVRWRVLPASARATVRVGLRPDGVITVRDIRVSSGNPVIALALRAARKPIRAEIGRSHDLNEILGLGSSAPRLHDVRVTIDDDITITARLG